MTPPATPSIQAEAMPLLTASRLVYGFSKFVREIRRGKKEIQIPEDSPLTREDLDSLKENSADLRGFNNGNGLSLKQLNDIVKANDEFIRGSKQFKASVPFIDLTREYFKQSENSGGIKAADKVFVPTFRCLHSNVSCVYGLLKDTCCKKIIVCFRGSMTDFSTRDWRTNANFLLTGLATPEMIKDKMPEGRLRERIMVHSGFHTYLFKNEKLPYGVPQRFDQIMKDLESVYEEGYSIQVTGHSLGGALATLFAFNLAGNAKYPWVPRPITLIDFCSPMSGTSGYREAFQQMELSGLVRHLRVTNADDPVPTALPISFWPIRPMKHTGINLRLSRRDTYRVAHSSMGGLINALLNSMIKPFWRLVFGDSHGVMTVAKRMCVHEELKEKTIDELYKDPSVVSKEFLEANQKDK